MAMDVVDYQIRGEEMQFVEIELDPGQAEVGEAGSMMFMDAGIAMDTVFGDGAASQGGLLGKLFGAGKRLKTGESLFTTVYTNQGQGTSRRRSASRFITSGKSRPRCLAVRVCSLPRSPARAPCGCKACRSRAWRRGSSPRRRSAAVRAKRARCWAASLPAGCSAACSVATTMPDSCDVEVHA